LQSAASHRLLRRLDEDARQNPIPMLQLRVRLDSGPRRKRARRRGVL